MLKKVLRKIVSKIRRTFVTDCPVCHKHFYGFHDYDEHLKVNGVHYRIVCHRCTGAQKLLK